MPGVNQSQAVKHSDWIRINFVHTVHVIWSFDYNSTIIDEHWFLAEISVFSMHFQIQIVIKIITNPINLRFAA